MTPASGETYVLVDRNELGEAPIRRSAGTCVSLVADGHLAHGGPDLRSGAGDVVAEHEGQLVLQESFELPVADHFVQRVDAGGAHSDQDVAVADGELGTSAARRPSLPYFSTMNAFMSAIPLRDLLDCLRRTMRMSASASAAEVVDPLTHLLDRPVHLGHAPRAQDERVLPSAADGPRRGS